MAYEPGSKLVVLGMVIPPLIGNPYNGYINPYYWVDDHPLLYGNNVSLDPGTYETTIFLPPFSRLQLCPRKKTCSVKLSATDACFFGRSKNMDDFQGLAPWWIGPSLYNPDFGQPHSLKLTVLPWKSTPGKGDSYWKPIIFWGRKC